MRPFYRISFVLVAACLLLAGNFSIADAQQQEAILSTHFKNQQYNKAQGYSLNKDGEQVIPQGHQGRVASSNSHAANEGGTHLFLLPGAAYTLIASAVFSTITFTNRVHEFVPLFYFLLFPKHWFW